MTRKSLCISNLRCVSRNETKTMMSLGFLAAAFIHFSTSTFVGRIISICDPQLSYSNSTEDSNDFGVQHMGNVSNSLSDGIVYFTTTSVNSTGTMNDSNTSKKIERPVMHTFYEPIVGGCCGMTQEGHEELLMAWQDSWQAHGWDTRIITLEDAKQHPDFRSLSRKLDKPPLFISIYNRYCFLRWLAMASHSVGGGWMSDYDTFPLDFGPEEGIRLSQNGTFHTFAQHTPCLIHASRKEWDRVIHLLMAKVEERPDWARSDMLALEQVYFSPKSAMIWDMATIGKFPYIIDPDSGNKAIDCSLIKSTQVKALHLSHKSTEESWKEGLFPLDRDEVPNTAIAISKRGKAADVFMKDFIAECLEKQ